MNSLIAIIPARGGSKRIPRKNIKPFLGRPILARVIENALSSRLFKNVVVSTDDDEIAEVAASNGALVPRKRSEANSNDHATTAAVIQEVLSYPELQGSQYSWFACIYPVAVLITPEILQKAWLQLQENPRATSLMSTVRYGHPIQRALEINDTFVRYLHEEFRNTRTQDLPPRFHDAGQFYFHMISSFLKSKRLVTENCAGFELSELECQDIDTLSDWRLAEIKARLRIGHL